MCLIFVCSDEINRISEMVIVNFHFFIDRVSSKIEKDELLVQ